MRKLLIFIGILAGVIILLFASGTFFIVDETEQIVITRFGKPVRKPIMTAGLHIKAPSFIEAANRFDKRILRWDGEPSDAIPTAEKTRIHVDTFARWRIEDPLLFYQSLRDVRNAIGRLDAIINGATRNTIASMNLIEIVRSTNREFAAGEMAVEITDEEALREIKFGREKIMAMILEQAAPRLKDLGISLEDVQLKRVDYAETVRRAVYERMVSERRRAAEQFRSEGQGEKARIEGQMELDLNEIRSEAERQSREIRGRADREALNTLSRAYGRDPNFFAFYQTLQSYEESLKKGDVILFSTDNEYIKYLKSPTP